MSPAHRAPSTRARLVAALLLGSLVAACRSGPPRLPDLREEDYPGAVRSPALVPWDALLEQRVTAAWPGADPRAFDAALQKLGDQLTLVGLAPVGAPGFVLVLRGEIIERFEDEADRLPFPPRFILIDVQRVFWPHLDGPVVEGRRAGVLDGEAVVERLEGGRVVERRFRRLDGVPPGEIVVRATWADGDDEVPSHAILENGWFGYTLTIETQEVTPLAPASAPAGASP